MQQLFNKKQGFPKWEDHITVLDKSKRANWLLRCNMCSLEFQGGGQRALVHLTGEGKGVRKCTQIPEELKRKFDDAKHSAPSGQKSDDGRPVKIQGTLLSHSQKFIAAEATKELALFACTSGVSFHAFKNPHFIKYSKILNQLYTVPSPYTLKFPALDNADEEINAWKDGIISSSLVCLTSDGYTNVKLVNLINFCNTKLKAQLEKKEPVDYGTDEEFGEEKEFENEQQQEEET